MGSLSLFSVMLRTVLSGIARMLHPGGKPVTLPSQNMKEHTLYLKGPDDSFPKEYAVSEIERIFGITYTPQLFFENNYTYQYIKKVCQKLENRRQVSQNAKWSGALYQNELESGFVSPVYIGWTDEKKQWGLFARKAITADAFIGEYAGKVELAQFFFSNLTPYSFHYPIPLTSWLWCTINPFKFGKETRFINHSDESNCRSVVIFLNGIYRIGICSNRPIEAGEELTFHYGLTVWGGSRTFE